jgi:hypothetical protein
MMSTARITTSIFAYHPTQRLSPEDRRGYRRGSGDSEPTL